MRIVALDVETTHLNVNEGRIIEIGCVELINNKATNNEFHVYLNPNIQLSTESIRITGLTNEFLSDKPLFEYIVQEFLSFIGDSPIIAHNATFDISYLNKELKLLQYDVLKNEIIDTLQIARKKYRQQNSLNGLCKRFNININHRDLHGALIDARLLASIYHYLIHETIELNLNLDIEIQETIYSTIQYHLSVNDEQLHQSFINTYKLQKF